MMKGFWGVLIVLCSAFTTSDQLPNLSPVTRALGEGDATTIGQYLDKTVVLTVLSKQTMASKETAVAVLKDFFNNNRVKSFSEMHQGSSKGAASHYSIGDLRTASGDFRVYIYYKTVADRPVIQELSIEK